MRTKIIAFLACVPVVACGGDGTAPTIADGLLALRAATPELTPGQTTELRATIAGRAVNDGVVQWTSRDASTVAIAGSSARAAAPGQVYLVGAYAGYTDSVLVTVRFANLETGMTGIRVGGAVNETLRLTGIGSKSSDLNNSGIGLTTINASSRSSFRPSGGGIAVDGDTVLTIFTPNELVKGANSLEKIVAQMTPAGPAFSGRSGVTLRIREGRSIRYFIAVAPSTLEITDIAVPAVESRSPGLVRGRVMFEAAGLLVDTDGSVTTVTPIGDETVRVFAEFVTPFYRLPLAITNFDFIGTPIQGQLAAATGSTNAARLVGSDLVAAFQIAGRARLTLTVPAGNPRTIALSPTGASAQLVIGDATATSSAGSLVVTEYRAPTATNYGLIAAQLTATFAFGSANSSDRQEIRSTLRIPVEPTGGPPTP